MKPTDEQLQAAREWIGNNREVIDGWSEQLVEGDAFAPRLAALLAARESAAVKEHCVEIERLQQIVANLTRELDMQP